MQAQQLCTLQEDVAYGWGEQTEDEKARVVTVSSAAMYPASGCSLWVGGADRGCEGKSCDCELGSYVPCRRM